MEADDGGFLWWVEKNGDDDEEVLLTAWSIEKVCCWKRWTRP